MHDVGVTHERRISLLKRMRSVPPPYISALLAYELRLEVHRMFVETKEKKINNNRVEHVSRVLLDYAIEVGNQSNLFCL